MWTIRKAQVETFQRQAVRTFEEQMVEHLTTCFPGQCQQMREEEIRLAIQYGIERAAAYGIDVEQQIARYINYMFLFGADFDRDSELPWTAEILTDPSITDQEERLDELSEMVATLYGPAEAAEPGVDDETP